MASHGSSADKLRGKKLVL